MSEYGDEDRFFSDAEEAGPEYHSDFKDRERAGGRRGFEHLQGDVFLGIKKFSKTESAESRFSTAIQAISVWMKETKIYDVGDEGMTLMDERSRILGNIRYYNPTAYILGFIASGGGN